MLIFDSSFSLAPYSWGGHILFTSLFNVSLIHHFSSVPIAPLLKKNLNLNYYSSLVIPSPASCPLPHLHIIALLIF